MLFLTCMAKYTKKTRRKHFNRKREREEERQTLSRQFFSAPLLQDSAHWWLITQTHIYWHTDRQTHCGTIPTSDRSNTSLWQQSVRLYVRCHSYGSYPGVSLCVCVFKWGCKCGSLWSIMTVCFCWCVVVHESREKMRSYDWLSRHCCLLGLILSVFQSST